MDRLIESRRDNLSSIKRGAVALDQTQFIWVKMVTRPRSDKPELIKTLKLRRKFNDAIADVAKDNKNMLVMNLTTLTEFKHFDDFGNLTASGQATFWKEVNAQVHKFDNQEIALHPNTKNFITVTVDQQTRTSENRPS